MDTKLKNIRYSGGFKVLAAVLCVAGAWSFCWGLRYLGDFSNGLQDADYARSQECLGREASLYGSLYTVAFEYGSEADIASGKFVENRDDYKDQVNSFTQSAQSEIDSLKSDYQPKLDDAAAQGDVTEQATLNAALAAQIQSKQNILQAEIDTEKKQDIQSELDEYHAALQYLNDNTSGMEFAAFVNGQVVASNIGSADAESFFNALPVHARLDSGSDGRFGNYYSYNGPSQGQIAYVGMSERLYNTLRSQFEDSRAQGLRGIALCVSGIVEYLLGLCWLLWAAGRSRKAEGVKLLFIDRLYMDIFLALVIAVMTLCCGGLYALYTDFPPIGLGASYTIGAVLAALAALIPALYLASAARRIKRREFLKHTLIYVACAWCFRLCRHALDAGPTFLKSALQLFAYAAVSILFVCGVYTAIVSGQNFGALISFALLAGTQVAALAYAYKKQGALKAILEGVKKIKSGDLVYRITPAGGAPYADIANAVNTIAEGLNAAVEDRVRAERMKAELITNVSHDLKTPLTSILTYVDLLKAEGPSGENFPQYVEILDAKAKRLKALTEDLFEAAKAASGSIKPAIARLDAAELLSQGLGELAGRIRESSLDFRVSMPGGSLFIRADGRLLWRVLENLFSNAFKYAMPNSRVYVSAAQANGLVRIEVKNISAYELNIPAEELTERFTRGDESRGSEGSGLGLAIAKSLTELQGGRFRVEVDGDLFKAIVEFKEDI